MYINFSLVEVGWPNGLSAALSIEWSWFEHWPGLMHDILRQDTSLTVLLSTQKYLWVPGNFILEGTPVMD